MNMRTDSCTATHNCCPSVSGVAASVSLTRFSPNSSPPALASTKPRDTNSSFDPQIVPRHDAARFHLVQHPSGGNPALGRIEHQNAPDIRLAHELVLGPGEYAANAIEIVARRDRVPRAQLDHASRPVQPASTQASMVASIGW